MPSTLIVNAGGALACALLLGYGYFLEFVEGLDPCPLCLLQRGAFVLLAAVFLAAAAHRPRTRGGSCAYGAAAGLAAATGAGIAGWHLRLQSLPPGEVPGCGPGLGYMWSNFPLGDTIRMVFTGSGECAEVSWSFLFLSLPAWALVWFVVLGTGGVVNNFRRPLGFRSRLFN